MASKKRVTRKISGEVLKAMMVFSRTVDHVLEERVVDATEERISGSKLQLLQLLCQKGPQTPTQISRFLGVSKPAVTRISDALLEDDLVCRESLKRDRRGLILRVTEKGNQAFEQIREEQHHLILSALRNSEAGVPQEWIRVLQEMSVALARADETFEDFCLQCGAYSDGSCILVGGGSPCLFLSHGQKVDHPGTP